MTKYQKFEALTIQRSQINNAPYNPRKISTEAQKALKRSLKVHGLVEPLVYNQRTGNLVGGHQRLSQLDALEKTQDYQIIVSAIDVDLKQEKEINIALNNPSMQGEYDFDILKELLPEIEVANTGFTDYDLSIIGVDFDIEEQPEPAKKSIDALKAVKKAAKDKNISLGENYIVVTFSSVEAKESFLDSIGHEGDDRYIKGEILSKKLQEGGKR